MQQHKQHSLVTPLGSLFFILLSSLNVAFATAGPGENPFTPKAHLIRYWNKAVQNDAEKPSFLLSKASPLSAVDSAAFAELAAQNALSTRLSEFCSSANLLCFPDVGQSLENHDGDMNFTAYSTKNFTNYGTARWAGVDSFKNYSVGDNSQVDSFRRYSRDTVNHTDNFNSYGPEANLVDQSFNNYATGAVAGTGEFKNYADSVNVPNLRFNSYSDDSTERAHAFTAYSENANAGGQSFTSYSKHGNGAPNEFTGYGTDANTVGSGFTSYSEAVNGADDKFNNYGNSQNNPQNKFKSYGDNSNAAVETFTSYRDSANVGDDSFQSYAKNSDGEKVNFVNYGKSFEVGSDKFTGYGKGARGESVGFKIYGVNNSFSDYAKNESISFKGYTKVSGSLVKRNGEPGKFFRESMLKKGIVMPMPDIQDKMPKRSFLPRTISSKLPFATSKIYELKRIFQAPDNSTMEKIMLDALRECERAPSAGETKRCVASAEDMIDFATSVLGTNVVVRTTDNVNGSRHNVLIGSVKGINGGNVTKSVSCHQSLFPYLLYYCHSVPKVRVYEADLLDPISKAKINHGVAICHLDTSAWSPTHGAFVALGSGSGPGRIEVCHWIFQNDMTWAVAD